MPTRDSHRSEGGAASEPSASAASRPSQNGTRKSGRQQKEAVATTAKTSETSRPVRQRKPVKFMIQEIGTEESKPAPVAKPAGPVDRWEVYYRRLQTIFKRVRFLLAFIDTYEGSGWKSANAEKAKPLGDLLKAKLDIAELKMRIKHLFRDIDAECAECTHFNAFPGKGPSTSREECGKYIPSLRRKPHSKHATKDEPSKAPEDDGIEAEEIGCSKCGDFEADDDNDILLCDYSGCGLAYHLQCVDPPETSLPGEDDDWLCRRCTSLVKCVFAVNEEFETAHDRWDDFFPEAEEEMEESRAELAAWQAAEDIRKSKLRGSIYSKSKNKSKNEKTEGSVSDEESEESEPKRPLRASAAAARVIIQHKLKKSDKLAVTTTTSPKQQQEQQPHATEAESSTLTMLTSPSRLADDSDDSSFYGKSDDEGSGEEGSGEEGSGEEGSGEEGSGEDSDDDNDNNDDDSNIDGSSDGEGSDEPETTGKRRRREMEEELSGEELSGAEETDGPLRSRRLAKKARIDYITLNEELFGKNGAEAVPETLLDDDTDWSD